MTENGTYFRTEEDFSERAYGIELLKKCLNDADLDVLAVLGDMSERTAEPTDERIIFVTRKR